MKINEYLTIKEAAEYLGVSTSTLKNWEKSGKLKPHRNKVNGYRLYKLDELDEFLDAVTGR